MRAASTMTRDVVCVPTELPLRRAWELMQQMRVRHLPVVSNGALVGVLSDRDLLLRSATDLKGRVVVGDGVVGEAMALEPRVCHPSTSVSALAQTMIDHKIDALPVVSEADLKRVVGLVTSTDLLWLLIDAANVNALPIDFNLHAASKEGELMAA